MTAPDPSPSQQASPETAGVIAPPPLLFLGALLAGVFADWAAPLPWLDRLAPAPVLWGIGGAAMALGLLSAAMGSGRFRSAGTPVEPWKASQRLVTDGIFAHVRNPMYLGFFLLAFGLGVAAAGEFVLVAGLALVLVIHFGVVLREERYLARRFGQDYLEYRARTPRYGWRF